MKHLAAIILSLIAQPVCALVINVAPGGNANATLADIKKNPNAALSLTQALALLKDPTLRTPSAPVGASAAGEPAKVKEPFALSSSKGNVPLLLPTESITIQLAAGIYRLTEAIHLDVASSGSAEYPITIQGSKDGSAIISGGRSVNGFTPVTDPASLARLPATARPHILQANLVKQGITDYGQQFRHGFGASNAPTALEVTYHNQPMTLARWPNQGFAKIATTPDGEKGYTFTIEGVNLKAWKEEPNLLATGYWFQDWADATIPVKSIDPDTQKITLTSPNPPYGIKAGQRVFIQNALAELDQPGEWYLDTTNGTLYIWPTESTDAPVGRTLVRQESPVIPAQAGIQSVELEVSLLEKLLIIDNTSHIRINNITFQSARGDAITVRGGHHVAIAHSVIRNIGNRAAVISGQDNGLTDMLIENIGEGGVVLEGGDRQTLTPANLYAERSSIRRFARVSRTYQPAVRLSGVGNRAVGNTISDSGHTAILFTGNDHHISQNEIFNVCRETGDAGVIYTGRDWTARGTVISQNYLHDISPNIAWGRTKGVYLDDQASGIIVRGNQFDKVYEAVFIGGGRDNLIEDNVFRDGTFPIHLDARGKNWKGPVWDAINITLQQKLKSVPYNLSPYKDRYPHLANILEDDLGMPKYNIVRNNIIFGKQRSAISKDAELGITIMNSTVIDD